MPDIRQLINLQFISVKGIHSRSTELVKKTLDDPNNTF